MRVCVTALTDLTLDIEAGVVGLVGSTVQEVDVDSTGMKQRVKLVQALVHDPQLLLDPAR